MKDLKLTYTKEHLLKASIHTYPTEWIIRTMLGNYPDLKINRDIYKNAKILDVGFGDCRNMPLLYNIGLEIYGIEISEEIVQLAYKKLHDLNIPANLKVGTNTSIPFDNNFFDIILSSSSIYYVDENSTFYDNLKEYLRVLKKDGILIANFPEKSKSFICKNAINLNNGHIRITNDVHNLRNGYIFKVFESKEQINKELSPYFRNISVGYLYEEYYGYELSMFILVAEKK